MKQSNEVHKQPGRSGGEAVRKPNDTPSLPRLLRALVAPSDRFRFAAGVAQAQASGASERVARAFALRRVAYSRAVADAYAEAILTPFELHALAALELRNRLEV